MTNFTKISFPSFGIEIDPIRYIDIGPMQIYLYGIIIAAGLLLATFYGMRRCKEFGLTQDDILNGVLCIVPVAIIFARAYYCIFSWQEYAADPASVFYIWNGGLAIYGGVIGAVLGIIAYCYFRKIKIGAILDLVMLGFLIGQSIGRWGNFFNREAYGAVTESFFRMGLFNAYSNSYTYYHPTFLYESVWNAVGFVLLHFLSKKRKFDGQIALGYAAWYGLGRTFIEGLRMDSLYMGPFRVSRLLADIMRMDSPYIGPFRISQLLAAISCVVALAVLFWQSFRKHDPADLFVNQRAVLEAEAAAEETEEVETEEPVEEPAQQEDPQPE